MRGGLDLRSGVAGQVGWVEGGRKGAEEGEGEVWEVAGAGDPTPALGAGRWSRW